ncbi:hypothetical protein N0V90_002052 [Kalmusia sp. IMI 367209]|nr:hypothetical protein N0V90_002052 [Kalmusia sp. IMI 367209]
MNSPLSGQKHHVIDDKHGQERIIELDNEILHAGIKLAEHGVSALFEESLEDTQYAYEYEREEMEPQVQELWQKTVRYGAWSTERYGEDDDIEKDDPNFVPTFEAIDWSEKPGYERLDRAINEFFASAKAQDLE